MNSDDSIVKNQHYVPQFYLRRFLNRNDDIEILDHKLMKCIRPRGTGNICSEDFFYGIHTGDQDEVSQLIEKWFGDIENKISGELDAIISKILNNRQILPLDKLTIASLMSMLWIRGPAMRKQIQNFEEQATKWINEYRFSIIPIEKIFEKLDKEAGKITPSDEREKIKAMMINKDYSIKPTNELHLRSLDNFKSFANLFYFQHWTVYVSKLPKKFVTTDNPLAVRFPKSDSIYPPTLLERNHHFALTPDIFIVTGKIIEPNTQGKRFKRKMLFKGDDEQVLELNTVLASQAQQYTYASDKQDLEDILLEAKRQREYFATPEGKIVKANLAAEHKNKISFG